MLIKSHLAAPLIDVAYPHITGAIQTYIKKEKK